MIKTFGLTEERNSACIRAVGDFREASKALTYRYVVPTMIFPACLLSGSSIALLLGAELLRSGELSPAVYLMFFLIGLRLYGPLLDLMDFSSLTRQMENALARVLEILDVKGEEDAGKVLIPRGHGVTFENVSFTYADARNRRSGIDNVSFFIPEGSMTALVGETGAGKSTIAKLLCRQYDAVAGRILIDGVPVSDIPRNELHRIVGVVSQDVFLFSETIRDNCASDVRTFRTRKLLRRPGPRDATILLRNCPMGMTRFWKVEETSFLAEKDNGCLWREPSCMIVASLFSMK